MEYYNDDVNRPAELAIRTPRSHSEWRELADAWHRYYDAGRDNATAYAWVYGVPLGTLPQGPILFDRATDERNDAAHVPLTTWLAARFELWNAAHVWQLCVPRRGFFYANGAPFDSGIITHAVVSDARAVVEDAQRLLAARAGRPRRVLAFLDAMIATTTNAVGSPLTTVPHDVLRHIASFV